MKISAISAAHFCDYVPVLGLVSNLTILFLKCVQQWGDPSSFKTRNWTYIKNKSVKDCLLLAIPFFGTLYKIFFYSPSSSRHTQRLAITHEAPIKNATSSPEHAGAGAGKRRTLKNTKPRGNVDKSARHLNILLDSLHPPGSSVRHIHRRKNAKTSAVSPRTESNKPLQSIRARQPDTETRESKPLPRPELEAIIKEISQDFEIGGEVNQKLSFFEYILFKNNNSLIKNRILESLCPPLFAYILNLLEKKNHFGLLQLPHHEAWFQLIQDFCTKELAKTGVDPYNKKTSFNEFLNYLFDSNKIKDDKGSVISKDKMNAYCGINAQVPSSITAIAIQDPQACPFINMLMVLSQGKPKKENPESLSKSYYIELLEPASSSLSPSSAPTVPTSSEPAAPTSSEPAAPTSSEPAAPTSSEPAAPTSSAPTVPTSSEPAAPTSNEPTAPTSSEPASASYTEEQAKAASL